MNRLPWLWIVAILLVGALSVAALLAHNDPHYPAGFGFPGNSTNWQLFWITFWSSAFPSIVTAATITVLAGRYLNDRERRLDRHVEVQITTQRHRESMEWLQHQLTRALEQSADIRFSDPPTTHDVFYPRIRAVQEVLAGQPWPLWRRSLPDMGLLFVQLHAVDRAYRQCARLGDLFDRNLSMAVRLVTQRVALGLIDPVVQGLPERLTKQFIIGCAIGQAPGLLTLNISGDLRNEVLLEKAWKLAQTQLPESTESARQFGLAYAELTDALQSLQSFMQTVMEQDQTAVDAKSAPS